MTIIEFIQELELEQKAVDIQRQRYHVEHPDWIALNARYEQLQRDINLARKLGTIMLGACNGR